jgi:excisionase family DNA binding protein
VGDRVITDVAQQISCGLACGAEAAGSCITLWRWSMIGRCGRIGQTWQSESIVGKGKAMTDAEGEILTLDEVAAYLKAGKRTVYRLAQQGEIPAFKLGGTWRFRRTELDRWIAASIEKNPKQGKR